MATSSLSLGFVGAPPLSLRSTTDPPLFCDVGKRGSSGVPNATRTRVKNQRVILSPSTNERFRRYVQKRNRGLATVPTYGRLILETYLSQMEQFYFGRPHTTRCSALPASARDKDAIIFDMDGVLCNSEAASREVGCAVLRKLYGVDPVPADFAPFTGTGEENFLRGVAEAYGVSDFDGDEAKRVFFDLYIYSDMTLQVSAFAGVRSLVERIHDLGLTTGVASAADKIKVDANLGAIKLDNDGDFQFVTSSDDVVNKKPAPDVFLACAKGLGVDPARCTVVEDAVAGVTAAKAAGMRCIAVATSMDEDELRKAGADVVRKEPAFIELSDLFDEDVFGQTSPTGTAGTGMELEGS